MRRPACPPLYATPRDPTRKTLGGAVARVAKQLGTPLMPWQRHVADVAMEIDPHTGLLAYGEVDLTTPRQSGKTTLELGVLVHRCRTWAASRALYSAQSRLHAHKKGSTARSVGPIQRLREIWDLDCHRPLAST
jgi:hypothetical protein